MPRRESALRLWGREFARAREATGLSQDALAKAVHLSSSLIALWETGRRAPKERDVARCEEKLGTGGYLARLLTEWVTREISPEWLDRWREVEEQATTLLWFEPLVIPGLLQTEEYARAVLGAGRFHHTDIEGKVAERLDRQRVLDRDAPPFLVALLDESVLRRTVGGAETMADQLTHLAKAAERPNVVVQAVPFTSLAGAGFLSHFIVASFDGGNEVTYVDNQLRGEVVEQPDEVAMLRQLFERFRADALSKLESIELVRGIASELWTT